jgi:alkanesulfonate monooxygenase SsuD/methylene tetrahydromethanopterin reductase-like flavin-dependent oxidoreductase (luciferase family)
MAARTEQIAVGTHVLLAPLHNTLRLAEDAAVVDIISNGRLILGLGKGWRREEFEAFSVPLRGRHRVLEQQVAVLRQAWSDDLVSGTEELFRSVGVSVTPKPVQKGGPPIWIGGQTEASIRRAGRIGNGLMTGGLGVSPALAPMDLPLTVESFAEQMSWVRQELDSAGRDPSDFTFSISLPALLWEEGNAWTASKRHLWYSTWKYSDMADAHGRLTTPAVPPPPPPEDLAEFHQYSLLGSPEPIVERLRALDSLAEGNLHFIARMYWPGIDSSLLRESMALFSEGVIAQMR